MSQSFFGTRDTVTAVELNAHSIAPKEAEMQEILLDSCDQLGNTLSCYLQSSNELTSFSLAHGHLFVFIRNYDGNIYTVLRHIPWKNGIRSCLREHYSTHSLSRGHADQNSCSSRLWCEYHICFVSGGVHIRYWVSFPPETDGFWSKLTFVNTYEKTNLKNIERAWTRDVNVRLLRNACSASLV